MRPACGRVRAGCAPGGTGGGAATVRLVLHAIGGVISAAVVLAAFWAAVRLLAGRAFRRTAYPRRLLGPRRRGTVTLRLARASRAGPAAGRPVRHRRAAGQAAHRRHVPVTRHPSGRRGARLVHHQPAWPAVLPARLAARRRPMDRRRGCDRLLCPAADHRCRARRGGHRRGGGAGPPLAAAAAPAGGGPPGLPPAVRLPRHRPRRQPRPMAGRPARLHHQLGRRGHADLPGGVEPRRRQAEEHRRGHPPPPRRQPHRRLRRRTPPPGGTRPPRPPAPYSTATPSPRTASTWPPCPAAGNGSPTWKTRSRTCSSRPAPAAAKPPPPRWPPRTPARTAG